MAKHDDRIARNEATVRAFLKGWDDLDVEACMAQVTEDMCYLNQPLEAITGEDADAIARVDAGGDERTRTVVHGLTEAGVIEAPCAIDNCVGAAAFGADLGQQRGNCATCGLVHGMSARCGIGAAMIGLQCYAFG